MEEAEEAGKGEEGGVGGEEGGREIEGSREEVERSRCRAKLLGSQRREGTVVDGRRRDEAPRELSALAASDEVPLWAHGAACCSETTAFAAAYNHIATSLAEVVEEAVMAGTVTEAVAEEETGAAVKEEGAACNSRVRHRGVGSGSPKVAIDQASRESSAVGRRDGEGPVVPVSASGGGGGAPVGDLPCGNRSCGMMRKVSAVDRACRATAPSGGRPRAAVWASAHTEAHASVGDMWCREAAVARARVCSCWSSGERPLAVAAPGGEKTS